MISAQNNLKVFVSPLLGPTNLLTVNDLVEGELGFFNKTTGALIAAGSGEGYFALMKNGVILKSKPMTLSAGYATTLKSYAAPTVKTATVTVSTATAGETYVLSVEDKLVGMRGEQYFHGTYVAQTGDTVTTIATALVSSINNQLAREGKTSYLTITNAAGVITIVTNLQTYVEGKFKGRPVDFVARLSAPEDYAVLEVVTQAPSDGVGYGPYIAYLEYFAQGDHDHHRLIDWRNNFEWTGNATATGQYDVIVLTEDNYVKTANARVDAPMEYIVAFNTLGATPSPIIDAAVNGDITIDGVAYPGSSVIVSIDGTPESPVVANATTGVYQVTGVSLSTGEVLTATAQSGSNPISATSEAVTVTAT